MAHYWVHHCVLEPCVPSLNSTVGPPQLRQHPLLSVTTCPRLAPLPLNIVFVINVMCASVFTPVTQSFQADSEYTSPEMDQQQQRKTHAEVCCQLTETLTGYRLGWFGTTQVQTDNFNRAFLLCSVFLLLFVGLHLKIVNRCMKRGSSCHIVCFPNVTSSCSAVTFHIFQIPNTETHVRATLMHAHIDWEKETCINKHKHQTESKWKC